MPVPRHPAGLPERVVAKVVARRGRLHAYETIEPARTALVVVDMTGAFVEGDAACRATVPVINDLAGILRAAGGTVAWVTTAPIAADDPRMVAIVGAEQARLFHDNTRIGDPRSLVWPGLDVRPADLRAMKRGASAFFPGKCDLDGRLRERAIDTALIAGTVTNVCCESSARDAVEAGYRVIMVSDALTGHAHGLHEASLTTFYRIFGDVRPASEIAGLIATRTG